MKTFTVLAAALVALAVSSSSANAQVNVGFGIGVGGRHSGVGLSVRIGDRGHCPPPVVYCPPPVVHCPPPVVHCPPPRVIVAPPPVVVVPAPVVCNPDIDVIIVEDVRVWVPAAYGWRNNYGRRVWVETCPGYWTTSPKRYTYRGWWDSSCNSYVYRDRHGSLNRHRR